MPDISLDLRLKLRDAGWTPVPAGTISTETQEQDEEGWRHPETGRVYHIDNAVSALTEALRK